MQFGEALSPEISHRIMSEALEASPSPSSSSSSSSSSSPLLALDTAEAYPVPMASATAGRSERIIGDWLRAHRGRRERTALITKVSGPGDQPWIRGGPPRLDPRDFTQALEGSLGRLRVSEVDLVMLHWPDRYVPMFGEVEFDPSRSFFSSRSRSNGGNDEGDDGTDENDGFAEAERHFEDILSAAFDAVTQGKLRAIGLSNETPTGLLVASSVSRARRRRDRRERERETEGQGGGDRKLAPLLRPPPPPLFPGVAAVSNAYSLLARNFDSSGMAEACEATRVPLLGYGPLAAGLLSGKYEIENGEENGENGKNGGGENDDENDNPFSNGGPPLARLNRYRHEYAEEGRRYARTPRVREAVRSYVEIARRHGLRGGGAELALRFALLPRGSSSSSSSGRAAVFGATSVEQVRAAFAAAGVGALSKEVLEECDAVHARNPNPAP